MRFEHGSHRTECLAALIVLLLLLCCCSSSTTTSSSTSTVCRQLLPFGTTTETRQCLPPDEWDACGRHVYLRFCDAYETARLLAPADCDARGLDTLRRMDEEAREATALFSAHIDRYDCENRNSVSWTCTDCEEAYKQWMCAMLLPPVIVEGEVERLKPCRYICRLVEQRCPYFHPIVKEQYAGERVFKCIDPDIPDLDNIQADSSYGPAHRCYCPQHLNPAGVETGEEECHLLSLAQLRRNASRWGHHRAWSSGTALTGISSLVQLATALLVVAWWATRTR